jgi:hypothetical protein
MAFPTSNPADGRHAIHEKQRKRSASRRARHVNGVATPPCAHLSGCSRSGAMIPNLVPQENSYTKCQVATGTIHQKGPCCGNNLTGKHHGGPFFALRLEAKRLRCSSRAVLAICRITGRKHHVITGFFAVLA